MMHVTRARKARQMLNLFKHSACGWSQWKASPFFWCYSELTPPLQNDDSLLFFGFFGWYIVSVVVSVDLVLEQKHGDTTLRPKGAWAERSAVKLDHSLRANLPWFTFATWNSIDRKLGPGTLISVRKIADKHCERKPWKLSCYCCGAGKILKSFLVVALIGRKYIATATSPPSRHHWVMTHEQLSYSRKT